jgi:tetratricopeptide (TPR) repeat protein
MTEGFDPISLLTTSKVVRDGTDFRVVSPADPFLEKIERTTRIRDKMILAALALRHDPLNVAAHLEMSIYIDGLDAEYHMRAAITGGETIWGPVIEEVGPGFDWENVEAIEPLLDAYRFLGDELLEQGDLEGARNAFSRLLDLAPSDRRRAGREIEKIDEAISHYTHRP